MRDATRSTRTTRSTARTSSSRCQPRTAGTSGSSRLTWRPPSPPLASPWANRGRQRQRRGLLPKPHGVEGSVAVEVHPKTHRAAGYHVPDMELSLVDLRSTRPAATRTTDFGQHPIAHVGQFFGRVPHVREPLVDGGEESQEAIPTVIRRRSLKRPVVILDLDIGVKHGQGCLDIALRESLVPLAHQLGVLLRHRPPSIRRSKPPVQDAFTPNEKREGDPARNDQCRRKTD